MDTFLHVVWCEVHVRKLDTKKATLTAEELLQNAALDSQCPRLQAVCSHCPDNCFRGGIHSPANPDPVTTEPSLLQKH